MGLTNKMPLPFLIISLLLSGCSASEKAPLSSAPVTNGSNKQITLSEVQATLYQEAVLKILPHPETTEFRGVKALLLAGQQGVHICGFVVHKNDIGKQEETLFYVELREDNSTQVVHRGQVGTDPSKVSKVKFVCRQHEIM